MNAYVKLVATSFITEVCRRKKKYKNDIRVSYVVFNLFFFKFDNKILKSGDC